MSLPPSVKDLQGRVEREMTDLQKKHFLPRQKEAFLCMARCCDKKDGDIQSVHDCVSTCGTVIKACQEVIYGNLQDYQARLSRCFERCNDQGRESLPPKPTEVDVKAAEGRVLSCMDGCGKEFAGKLPKLKANIEAGMQNL